MSRKKKTPLVTAPFDMDAWQKKLVRPGEPSSITCGGKRLKGWRFTGGVFADCPWCGGKGCVSCPAEAEKAYRREFPNGLEPIVTIPVESFDQASISEATGGPSLTDAYGPMGKLVAAIYDQVKGGES